MRTALLYALFSQTLAPQQFRKARLRVESIKLWIDLYLRQPGMTITTCRLEPLQGLLVVSQ